MGRGGKQSGASTKSKRGFWEAVGDAINGLTDTAKQFLADPNAPPTLKTLFFLVLALFLLALLVSLGFMFKGPPEYALICAGGAVIMLFGLVLIFALLYGQEQAALAKRTAAVDVRERNIEAQYTASSVEISPPAAAEGVAAGAPSASERHQPTAEPTVHPAEVWTRLVPRLPIDRGVLDELATLLEQIRGVAFEHLKKLQPELEDRKIRANVFLPNYRDAQQGLPCVLFMPTELRIHMNYPPEWRLRLAPGQGLTGVVYSSGDQGIAKRLAQAEGEWDEIYQLSDAQKASLHRDLKWIISMPLKDPANENTLGVLNIDGLVHDFEYDTLSRVMTSLVQNTYAFAVRLSQQPQVKLTIRWEETKHG
jgi:hypothetical protein